MLPDIRPGNTKILYFFNCLLDGMHTILSLVTELYNDIIHEPSNKLGEEYVERIQYLRLRIAYEAGRDKQVAEFVRKSNLLGYVKQIKDNKKLFLLFTKYVEALVAYHKYYGGRDA